MKYSVLSSTSVNLEISNSSLSKSANIKPTLGLGLFGVFSPNEKQMHDLGTRSILSLVVEPTHPPALRPCWSTGRTDHRLAELRAERAAPETARSLAWTDR